MPKVVKQIPSTVTKIDLSTGKETHKAAAWNVLPPASDKCQICAVKHASSEPHNAQSIYYQMTFNGMVGRAPTWADAVAHCDDSTRHHWETELRRIGAWSEPPKGEKPIRHHGI
jgi:hypothetical protein